jgi:hypothetical protein
LEKGWKGGKGGPPPPPPPTGEAAVRQLRLLLSDILGLFVCRNSEALPASHPSTMGMGSLNNAYLLPLFHPGYSYKNTFLSALRNIDFIFFQICHIWFGFLASFSY